MGRTAGAGRARAGVLLDHPAPLHRARRRPGHEEGHGVRKSAFREALDAGDAGQVRHRRRLPPHEPQEGPALVLDLHGRLRLRLRLRPPREDRRHADDPLPLPQPARDLRQLRVPRRRRGRSAGRPRRVGNADRTHRRGPARRPGRLLHRLRQPRHRRLGLLPGRRGPAGQGLLAGDDNGLRRHRLSRRDDLAVDEGEDRLRLEAGLDLHQPDLRLRHRHGHAEKRPTRGRWRRASACSRRSRCCSSSSGCSSSRSCARSACTR